MEKYTEYRVMMKRHGKWEKGRFAHGSMIFPAREKSVAIHRAGIAMQGWTDKKPTEWRQRKDYPTDWRIEERTVIATDWEISKGV